MCGIIGYVGARTRSRCSSGARAARVPRLRLGGIALREEDGLDYVRASATSSAEGAAGSNGSHSRHGLGHTRWATHGAVTESTRIR
jgi:glucosamine--fructose-6-phosphate aminotransferase (isomerizing)